MFLLIDNWVVNLYSTDRHSHCMLGEYFVCFITLL